MKRKAANLNFYPLAIDESTDATNTKLLNLPFLLGVLIIEYNFTEEMASLVPLKDITKCLDFYDAVKITLKLFFLQTYLV